jgi:hypothetical protein
MSRKKNKNKTGQGRQRESGASNATEMERLRVYERLNKRKMWVEVIGRVCPVLLPVIGAVAIVGIVAWAFVVSAPYFAGRDTDVSYSVEIAAAILGNIDIAAIVTVIGFGGVCLSVARKEKRLRSRETERLGSEKRQEQLQRDPNRESSGYTASEDPVEESR